MSLGFIRGVDSFLNHLAGLLAISFLGDREPLQCALNQVLDEVIIPPVFNGGVTGIAPDIQAKRITRRFHGEREIGMISRREESDEPRARWLIAEIVQMHPGANP